MTITKYPSPESLEEAIKAREPLLVVISFDGQSAIASPLDEAVEHHILLAKAGIRSTDIDKYFRIVLDEDGAAWTFVCPPDYKGIEDKTRRIREFYKDGFAIIPQATSALGYMVGIDIPRRYRRHFDMMGE